MSGLIVSRARISQLGRETSAATQQGVPIVVAEVHGMHNKKQALSGWRLAGAGGLIGAAVGAASIRAATRMPGRSHQGSLPPLTPEEQELAIALRSDVETLAVGIGERHTLAPDALMAAAGFLERSLIAAGCETRRQVFEAGGVECVNVESQISGAGLEEEIIVVGGHYDTIPGCPGAITGNTRPARTIRFVCFVNEEPPYFQTAAMGSRVYARECRERGERIVGMLSLETMGCYSDLPGSQHYPLPTGWLYPSTGEFIAFVGNIASGALTRSVVERFRRLAHFPSEGAILPGAITGLGWSDHWSFWQEGYPAIMVTDTAPFRYVYYHTPEDTPDKIDYERFARVVAGLQRVVAEMGGISK